MAKTAQKRTSGQATPMVAVAGSGFRYIPGEPCGSCGGPTFLATFGPKRPAVRVCDSVGVVTGLLNRFAVLETEILKIQKEHASAVEAAIAFEATVTKGGADLLKVVGPRKDAKPEEIASAIEKRRESLAKAVNEAAKAAVTVPAKQAEVVEIEARLAVTNEFCQAVYGWRSDRMIRPPTRVAV